MDFTDIEIEKAKGKEKAKVTGKEKETKKRKKYYIEKETEKDTARGRETATETGRATEKAAPGGKPETALILWNLPQANTFQSFSPRRVRGENTMTQPPWAAFTSDVASLVVGEAAGEPAPLRRSLTVWSQRG